MKGRDLHFLKKNIQKYSHLFYIKEKFMSELHHEKGLVRALDVSFCDYVIDKMNMKI
jgi:hypothetical protein